jgi:DNA-nicking Smr family endonuclease
MAGKEPRADEDRAAWQESVAGATPLEERDKTAAPEAPKTVRRRKVAPPPVGGPPTLAIERFGEQVEGRSPGADDALLRRLRNGEYPPEERVDLHGMRADAAKRALEETLKRVWFRGGRCFLVIHGRGQHSEDGSPVLKELLFEWLSTPPLVERVVAFTSARGRDGGVGATYVLLRRERS